MKGKKKNSLSLPVGSVLVQVFEVSHAAVDTLLAFNSLPAFAQPRDLPEVAGSSLSRCLAQRICVVF